jgi:hypothetical protein
MDMSVIKSFKGYFRQFLVLQLIDRRERGLDDNVLLDNLFNEKCVGYCYTCNSFKLFQKSRLIIRCICKKETVAEGEPAFYEWLKHCEIKTFKHVPDIEDFVNADDDLATSEVPTDDDIIDAVLQKEDSDQDSDEYIEETVPAKQLVTYSEAQDAVQMLMNFFKSSETVDDSTFNAISIIKRNLRDMKVKPMKQVSIQNYISNKQGNK